MMVPNSPRRHGRPSGFGCLYDTEITSVVRRDKGHRELGPTLLLLLFLLLSTWYIGTANRYVMDIPCLLELLSLTQHQPLLLTHQELWQAHQQ